MCDNSAAHARDNIAHTRAALTANIGDLLRGYKNNELQQRRNRTARNNSPTVPSGVYQQKNSENGQQQHTTGADSPQRAIAAILLLWLHGGACISDTTIATLSGTISWGVLP